MQHILYFSTRLTLHGICFWHYILHFVGVFVIYFLIRTLSFLLTILSLSVPFVFTVILLISTTYLMWYVLFLHIGWVYCHLSEIYFLFSFPPQSVLASGKVKLYYQTITTTIGMILCAYEGKVLRLSRIIYVRNEIVIEEMKQN